MLRIPKTNGLTDKLYTSRDLNFTSTTRAHQIDMMNSLITALPMLGDALLFLMIIFIGFDIMGQ